MITRRRCLEALEHSALQIGRIVAESPDAEVPRYPGSNLEGLVRHVITIHEWVTELVSDLAPEAVPQQPPDATITGAELHDRFDAAWRRLADVLAAADEASPVWTFGSDRTAAFWVRRMAHETALHAWDAESAVSEQPAPIPLDLAVTGLGEGLRIHVQRPLRRTEIGGTGETVSLWCTDADAAWSVTLCEVGIEVADGNGGSDAAAAGTASDLWLWVGGRTPAAPIVRSGDAGVLERFESALRTIRAAM